MPGVPGLPQVTEVGRVCRGCRKDLPWERFNKLGHGLHGRDSRCKACVAARKAVADKRPESRAVRAEAQKRYRKRHPERALAASLAWIASQPNYERNRGRRRYAEDPSKQRAATKKWLDKNPAKAVEYRQRRRSLVLGALVDDGVTDQQWLEVLDRYDHRCAYCFVGGVKLEMEHVIPLVRGGLHTVGNTVPACRRCNASKGDKLLKEWL